MFQLWMNSIHCYCRLDDQKNKSASNIADSDEGMKKKKYLDPPVVFVGSHKDQVTPSAGEEVFTEYLQIYFIIYMICVLNEKTDK